MLLSDSIAEIGEQSGGSGLLVALENKIVFFLGATGTATIFELRQ